MAGIESDYAGRSFNALRVIRCVGRVQHGRNAVKVWLCRCLCGNTLEVDQASLVKGLVPACKTCRRGPCVICGAPIINDDWGVKRTTCSDLCQREQLKAKHKRRYYKLIALNPEHNKQRHSARRAADPLYEQKRYQLRLKRLIALPVTQRQLIIKKQNEYSNVWRSAYVKKLKETDYNAYLTYRKTVNAYFINWYRKNKLKNN
ncbi:hypothetical protein G3479_11450 [Shewanella baltica]|uniref:hypothetical protein n=1 Tax=Shewanella baltica TaxID=62322 RepID=UPI00217E01E7|nr:hypothetical protein [Shewanella baltica]MCS6259862.1 hypothetical protein [Shewanella baltica]